MPVHRVGRNTHGNPLTPSGTHERHSRPPYPHARTQTRVTPSNTRSAHWPGDAFSLDSSQPAELAGDYMQGDPHGPDRLMPEPISDEEDQDTDTSSLERGSADLARLELLDLDQWDESHKYDEDPPSCLHYLIEWKVMLNGKLISRDTERDLVLAPRFYWSLFLREKLEKLVQKKLSHKRITCEDTSVVVAVTERSERDLIKRFDDIDIDWTEIEEQLVEWGDRFRAGKKLRVDVSFNYLELGQPASTAAGKAGKRGYRSATQHMLAERAAQLGDEETTGQPSIWRDVYNLMRCPGPPCHLGPYCWQDREGNKHYKLMTLQLKGLIRHVEKGGQLRTHDDVPDDIRQELYAGEQQRLERQQIANASTAVSEIGFLERSCTHTLTLTSVSMYYSTFGKALCTPTIIFVTLPYSC